MKVLLFIALLASPLFGEVEEAPIVRGLTNTKGIEVEAQLEKLEGEIIHVKIKGKRYQLKLSTLTGEGQEFLRKWAKEEAE